MESSECKIGLISSESEGERDSTVNKDRQFYFVKFNPRQDRVVQSKITAARNHHYLLKWECGNLFSEIYKKKLWKEELKRLKKIEETAREILAWKNEKLIVELKVLRRQSSEKHQQQEILKRRDNTNNLQNVFRHQSKSLRSEEKILKEMSNSDRKHLGNDSAILALKESTNTIYQYSSMMGSYYWSCCNKLVIESQVLQEFYVNIREVRQIWLEDSDHKIAPDEKQMKLLMQDTVTLMCLIMEVTRKVLVAVVDEMKDFEEKWEKERASLQNKLTDLKLIKDETRLYADKLQKIRDNRNASYMRHVLIMKQARKLAKKKGVEALDELSKTEVEKFMLNWNSSKGFRDAYRKRLQPSIPDE